MKKIFTIASLMIPIFGSSHAKSQTGLAGNTVRITRSNSDQFGIDLKQLLKFVQQSKLSYGKLKVILNEETRKIDISDLNGFTISINLDEVRSAQPNARD